MHLNKVNCISKHSAQLTKKYININENVYVIIYKKNVYVITIISKMPFLMRLLLTSWEPTTFRMQVALTFPFIVNDLSF